MSKSLLIFSSMHFHYFILRVKTSKHCIPRWKTSQNNPTNILAICVIKVMHVLKVLHFTRNPFMKKRESIVIYVKVLLPKTKASNVILKVITKNVLNVNLAMKTLQNPTSIIISKLCTKA